VQPKLILLACVGIEWSLASVPHAAAQSNADLVGYTELIDRLGAAAPDGTGIVVGQIEVGRIGPGPAGAYAPDPLHPQFAGKTFLLQSGASPRPSEHATTVALDYFGLTTSIAPGVATIYNWEANSWLADDYLHLSDSVEPDMPPGALKVFNHSWGGFIGEPEVDNDVLRRADFAVERDGTLMICGVPNGPSGMSFTILSPLYNGLAVGTREGLHSSADTPRGVDGPGRQKPEIVAPGDFTSWATPVVSAAAALMVDTARTDPALKENPNAEQPEVVKAVLLAGAKKEDDHGKDWTNHPATSGPNRGVTTTPLDDIVGAGTVNVDHGYRILTAGEQDGAISVPIRASINSAGWDLTTISVGQSRYYRFELNEKAEAISIAITWHRRTTPPTFLTTFPGNMNLHLWRVSKGTALTTLVGDAGLTWFDGGNVASQSAVDNIEHLYVTGLEPGDYVLETRRIDSTASQPQWDVGVAWLLPDQSDPADLDGDGDVDGFDLALLLGQWTGAATYVPCLPTLPPDLNGDCRINGFDLAILLGKWG
jgi:hypothetical protein